jgi:hypothetical protein
LGIDAGNFWQPLDLITQSNKNSTVMSLIRGIFFQFRQIGNAARPGAGMIELSVSSRRQHNR